MRSAARTKPKRARATARTKQPARRAANLFVRVDLVQRAKTLQLNLSRVLETALVAAIREREQQTWLADNEESIDAYNAQVAKHGLFSDDWRPF